MTNSRTYPEGVTSWIDIEHQDLDKAKAFYGALFGWAFTEATPPGAPFRYFIANLDGLDVAGLGGPAEDSSESVSSAWNTYIAVDNADDTAARVEAAGGGVVEPATDARDGGRSVVCRDPFAVPFRLWQAGKRLGAQVVNTPGGWNFSDLHAANPEASAEFYSKVFGWVFDDLGFATMIRVPGYGDQLAATIDPEIHSRQADVQAPPGFADAIGWLSPVRNDEEPHWHVSFTLADRDKTASEAERLGGTVLSQIDSEWTRDALDPRSPKRGFHREPVHATFALRLQPSRHAPWLVSPALVKAHDFARLLRRTDAVVPNDELESRLKEGKTLRVKLGLDPTAPAVTLGWAVVLRKLRDFQEQGHTAVLIVGDFTAQVGDPSLRRETRKRLTAAEVRGYASQVLSQFEKVLLPEPLEIRYNSEWLAALDMAEVLNLTSVATVAQLLERSDFATRFEANNPISVMEFLYPLLQGYDSVAVKADVELGGSDQLWNLMMGRVVQERYGQRPQIAMTMPLLVGTDGVHKMSQSLGNFIGVDEPAADIFGKVMSVRDEAMPDWFRLATELSDEQIAAITLLHPREAKSRLAREITALYTSEQEADDAATEFDRIFSQRERPSEIEEFVLPADDPVNLASLLRAAGLVASAGEARSTACSRGDFDRQGTPQRRVGGAEFVGRRGLEGRQEALYTVGGSVAQRQEVGELL